MANKAPMDASFYEWMLEDEPAVAAALGWKNDLCATCEGDGTTWNGIVLTQSDFDEDPEGQYEAIRDGLYDRQCPECNGEKVLSYISEDRTPEWAWEAYVKYARDFYYDQQVERQERMMGA
jgi:hypothetical protein